MGIDYSANIGIGFKLDEDDLMAFVSVKTIKEKIVRYEDRFCPKAGQKLEPERIVEPEINELTFIPDGRNCEEADLWGWNLAEEIAKLLRCNFEVTKDGTKEEYVFGPKLPTIAEGGDWGRFSFGPSYGWLEVASCRAKLDKLKSKFMEWDIDPGEPVIYNCAWCG